MLTQYARPAHLEPGSESPGRRPFPSRGGFASFHSGSGRRWLGMDLSVLPRLSPRTPRAQG